MRSLNRRFARNERESIPPSSGVWITARGVRARLERPSGNQRRLEQRQLLGTIARIARLAHCTACPLARLHQVVERREQHETSCRCARRRRRGHVAEVAPPHSGAGWASRRAAARARIAPARRRLRAPPRAASDRYERSVWANEDRGDDPANGRQQVGDEADRDVSAPAATLASCSISGTWRCSLPTL